MNEYLFTLATVLVIFIGLVSTAGLMTLAERKIAARIQLRIGPNRVGPWGLLQPLADGLKFIFKEELVPDGANKLMYKLAPAMSAIPAMMGIAVIPFATNAVVFGHEVRALAIADFEISALFAFAVGGLSIYGMILGGWASNSKYSLLGGLRATAQMVSYELALMLAVLSVVVFAGSLNMVDIIQDQGHTPWTWNIVRMPIAFVLFVIAMFAETNRHPFDFAECEPELVGGFHTEYSSMKFALFFVGEYCAMTVMACLTAAFFLGGGNVPFWPEAPWYFQVPAFLAKAGFFLFLFIWVRWTLPRFRFDQLMGLSWKVMLPVALANLFVYGALVSFGVGS
jgi:NADH-quinone oxidoreductase subunit H